MKFETIILGIAGIAGIIVVAIGHPVQGLTLTAFAVGMWAICRNAVRLERDDMASSLPTVVARLDGFDIGLFDSRKSWTSAFVNLDTSGMEDADRAAFNATDRILAVAGWEVMGMQYPAPKGDTATYVCHRYPETTEAYLDAVNRQSSVKKPHPFKPIR